MVTIRLEAKDRIFEFLANDAVFSNNALEVINAESHKTVMDVLALYCETSCLGNNIIIKQFTNLTITNLR